MTRSSRTEGSPAGRSRRNLPGAKGRALDRIAIQSRFAHWREPFAVATDLGALPGFVVSAVVELADQRTEIDGGALALRIGPEVLARAATRARLGRWIDRAARLCVVWDAREEQLIAACEDRRGPPAFAPQPKPRPLDEEDALWPEGRGLRAPEDGRIAA